MKRSISGFVILLSIWYGNKKTPAKAILDKPLKEVRKLEEDGIIVNGRKYWLVVLITTTDTVDRRIPWNCGQFDEKFGCNFCLLKGIRIPKGKGNVRVYPQPKDGLPVELRTLEQHKRDMTLAIRTGKTVNGIKWETPVGILPKFDYVKTCVPEYMHVDCLGVCKQFLKLFFFVIFVFIISFLVQSLEYILPSKYFNHFYLLSYWLNVLLQERVSVVNVKKCEVLFKQFVKDTETILG
jgi:hypothetical protein